MLSSKKFSIAYYNKTIITISNWHKLLARLFSNHKILPRQVYSVHGTFRLKLISSQVRLNKLIQL